MWIRALESVSQSPTRWNYIYIIIIDILYCLPFIHFPVNKVHESIKVDLTQTMEFSIPYQGSTSTSAV